MLVIMKSMSSPETIQNVLDVIATYEQEYIVSNGIHQGTVIATFGDEKLIDQNHVLSLSGVDYIQNIKKQHKLVSREFKAEDTIVKINDIPIGGKNIQVISGPCSVETPNQMSEAAAGVVDAHALLLRGGAFKPRTSPYAFQGHGESGLAYLVQAGKEAGLPVVTELMDPRDIELFLKYEVDVIQIGTRNMQNFQLLKEVGKLNIPVILKRGMSATIQDWLMAAEYIAAGGNMNIILAERGIRTYEKSYRNTLDISAIPFLKRETHLPVIVDPSHAGGAAWMVPSLSFAAIAAGADGLLVESHPNPANAWSDGDQSLTPAELKKLVSDLKVLAKVQDRFVSERTDSNAIQFPDPATTLLAA